MKIQIMKSIKKLPVQNQIQAADEANLITHVRNLPIIYHILFQQTYLVFVDITMIREYRITLKSPEATLYNEPLFRFDGLCEEMMSPYCEVKYRHSLLIRI